MLREPKEPKGCWNGCSTGSLFNLVRSLHAAGVLSLGCAGHWSRCGSSCLARGHSVYPGRQRVKRARRGPGQFSKHLSFAENQWLKISQQFHSQKTTKHFKRVVLPAGSRLPAAHSLPVGVGGGLVGLWGTGGGWVLVQQQVLPPLSCKVPSRW